MEVVHPSPLNFEFLKSAVRIRKAYLELEIRGVSYDPGPRSGQLSQFVASGEILGVEIAWVIKINHSSPRPLRGYLIESDDIHRCDGLFIAKLQTFPLLEIHHSPEEPPMKLAEARIRRTLKIEFERMPEIEDLLCTQRKIISENGLISMMLYFGSYSDDVIGAVAKEQSWEHGDRSIDLLSHKFQVV